MRWRVEALEKFVVRTVYHVEAETAEEAQRLCKDGGDDVAYDSASIEEGDEEWLGTVDVSPD